MILPKYLFKSLTRWVKANYTSLGWYNPTSEKMILNHESGSCEATQLNDLEFKCHQTAGVFGDYIRSSAGNTTKVMCCEFVCKDEATARALASVTSLYMQGEDLTLRRAIKKSLYIIVNSAASSRTIYDFNGSIAPSYEQAPYVNIRFFDVSIL